MEAGSSAGGLWEVVPGTLEGRKEGKRDVSSQSPEPLARMTVSTFLTQISIFIFTLSPLG